jgi:hypothetical protein
MRVTIANEVHAVEADRLILLAGTVVRGPLSSLGAFLD